MRLSPWITAGALVFCSFVTWLGNPDREVAFSTAGELWADVLRDADQFGLQLSRVSAKEEMDLGNRFASGSLRNAATSPAWKEYVNDVGATLAQHVRRRDIQYTFHVVESADKNAFAMPGGHIFVTTALLESLHTEAELAAVLGHEIAHVDARHAIERYQYQVRLKRTGLDQAGSAIDLMRVLISSGYAQYQELEADTLGLDYCVKAGYDPSAATDAFRKVLPQWDRDREAATPIGEMTTAVQSSMGAYFRTHPHTPERTRRLEAYIQRVKKRNAGTTFYTGRENYLTRTARSKRQFQ